MQELLANRQMTTATMCPLRPALIQATGLLTGTLHRSLRRLAWIRVSGLMSMTRN